MTDDVLAKPGVGEALDMEHCGTVFTVFSRCIKTDLGLAFRAYFSGPWFFISIISACACAVIAFPVRIMAVSAAFDVGKAATGLGLGTVEVVRHLRNEEFGDSNPKSGFLVRDGT